MRCWPHGHAPGPGYPRCDADELYDSADALTPAEAAHYLRRGLAAAPDGRTNR